MSRRAVRRNQGSTGRRIHTAVFQPHPVEHQLRAILPLHAKPIPADLLLPKLAARPFVIEPALALHLSVLPSTASSPVVSSRGSE